MSKIYDVIVLGAGPAGLAAGLYAGRSRLSVLIVEKGQDGGQISITDEIYRWKIKMSLNLKWKFILINKAIIVMIIYVCS